MLKAVLFDIDNTLILFDEENFFKHYVPGVAARFTDILSFEDFTGRLLGGSRKLLENNGRKTNVDFYMDFFSAGIEHRKREIWKRFETFYLDGFGQYRELVEPVPGVCELFDFLTGRPLKLVAASHPLWPGAVQKIRLGWAGLDPEVFHHSTGIENTTFCKPQPAYYREICDAIEVEPSECLMVGNDLINDMVASEIGMITYQTTDAEENGFYSFAMSRAIRAGATADLVKPDYRGVLSGVRGVVEALTAP